MLLQKLYTEDWNEEKTMFYPYSDSPELRRVAKAQEVLSDVCAHKFMLHVKQYLMVNIDILTSIDDRQAGHKCPFGKTYLSLLFLICYTVTMIHLNELLLLSSLPADCSVSFHGRFVFTDSALAFEAIPPILQPIKTVHSIPRF